MAHWSPLGCLVFFRVSYGGVSWQFRSIHLAPLPSGQWPQTEGDTDLELGECKADLLQRDLVSFRFYHVCCSYVKASRSCPWQGDVVCDTLIGTLESYDRRCCEIQRCASGQPTRGAVRTDPACPGGLQCTDSFLGIWIWKYIPF